MSKWARVNLNETSPILEVITYDPVGVINEAFLSQFLACPDEVEKGYFYNSETNTFYLPEGYAKHQNFEVFGYVQIPEGSTVDENGFIVSPLPPKQVSVTEFRNQLKLAEKILWDNPETGTVQQKAVIETVKRDFPYLETPFNEIMELLVQYEILTVERSEEILTVLFN